MGLIGYGPRKWWLNFYDRLLSVGRGTQKDILKIANIECEVWMIM